MADDKNDDDHTLENFKNFVEENYYENADAEGSYEEDSDGASLNTNGYPKNSDQSEEQELSDTSDEQNSPEHHSPLHHSPLHHSPVAEGEEEFLFFSPNIPVHGDPQQFGDTYVPWASTGTNESDNVELVEPSAKVRRILFVKEESTSPAKLFDGTELNFSMPRTMNNTPPPAQLLTMPAISHDADKKRPNMKEVTEIRQGKPQMPTGLSVDEQVQFKNMVEPTFDLLSEMAQEMFETDHKILKLNLKEIMKIAKDVVAKFDCQEAVQWSTTAENMLLKL